jgi:uncharacterized membrane protein
MLPPSAAAWQSFAAQTPIIPFVAIAAGRTRFNAAEIAAWRWFAAIHAYALFWRPLTHLRCVALSRMIINA